MSAPSPWTVRDVPDLRGKTAIVTGANSGIGFETARALTGLLLGRLRQMSRARIVTVSSSFHERGRIDFDDLQGEHAYDPKTAYLSEQAREPALRLRAAAPPRGERLDAVSLGAHPGYAATNLQRHVFLFRLTNPFLAQSAADGALPVLYAATAPEAIGGAYYGPSQWGGMKGPPERAEPSGRARDEAVARRLWTVSEQLTGVRFGL